MRLSVQEKEIGIIAALEKGDQITQRQIASTIGVSLGLTNLLIKNLLKKGFIQISRINQKKIHYILTREGLEAKSQQIIKYLSSTFSAIKELKEKIKFILLVQIRENSPASFKCTIVGDNELADITEIVLRELSRHYPLQFRRFILSRDIAQQEEIHLICDSKYKSVFNQELVIEDKLTEISENEFIHIKE